MRRRMARDPTKDRERPTEIGCCVIGQGRKAEGGAGRHDRDRAETRVRPANSPPMPVGPTRHDQQIPGGRRPIPLGLRQQNTRSHVQISRQQRKHQPREIRVAVRRLTTI